MSRITSVSVKIQAVIDGERLTNRTVQDLACQISQISNQASKTCCDGSGRLVQLIRKSDRWRQSKEPASPKPLVFIIFFHIHDRSYLAELQKGETRSQAPRLIKHKFQHVQPDLDPGEIQACSYSANSQPYFICSIKSQQRNAASALPHTVHIPHMKTVASSPP